MSNIIEDPVVVDPFGSQLVTSKNSIINLKPTWGISSLRYTTTTTGTGAAATETGGEFKLSTGTTTSNEAKIQTKQRGQYQAGTQGQFGVGIRIPTPPASTASVNFGYFDDNNGFFFGVDATSPFVARRTATSDTKVYQANWNVDKLDGTGVSGLTLDHTEGVIAQCKFTWYGYGLITFGFVLYNSTTQIFEFVPCHQLKVSSAASIVDPNQPLTVQCLNGASSTTNLDVYVGGHQFEYFAGASEPATRLVGELLNDYTTATNTDWQPLIAVRKKSTHGTSGRNNSVTAIVKGYSLSADGEVVTRLTTGGTTSNLAWATPTGWTSAESSVETKLTTSGTALTTSADGFPYAYDFVNSSKTALQKIDNSSTIKLGASDEVILWVKRLSASGAIVIKHANLQITEEW